MWEDGRPLVNLRILELVLIFVAKLVDVLSNKILPPCLEFGSLDPLLDPNKPSEYCGPVHLSLPLWHP